MMLERDVHSQRIPVTPNTCHAPGRSRRLAASALAGSVACANLLLAGCDSDVVATRAPIQSSLPPYQSLVWDQSTWDNADWE
jgi:hypothetical protein